MTTTTAAADDYMCIKFGPDDFGVYPRDRCFVFFELIRNTVTDTGDSGVITLDEVTHDAFDALYSVCDELVRTGEFPPDRIGKYAASAEFLLCPIFAIKRKNKSRGKLFAAIVEFAPNFVDLCDLEHSAVTLRACLNAISANNRELLEKLYTLSPQNDRDNSVMEGTAIRCGSVDCLDYLLTVRPDAVGTISIPKRITAETVLCLHAHGVPAEMLVLSAIRTDDITVVRRIANHAGGVNSECLAAAIYVNATAVTDALISRVPITPEIARCALIRGDLPLIRRITAKISIKGLPLIRPMRLDDEFLTFARDSGMGLAGLADLAIECDVPSALEFANRDPVPMAVICARHARKCLVWALERGEVLKAEHIQSGKDKKFLKFALEHVSDIVHIDRRFLSYCSIEQLREVHSSGRSITGDYLETLMHRAILYDCPDFLEFAAEIRATSSPAALSIASKAPLNVFTKFADNSRDTSVSGAFLSYDACRYIADSGGNIAKF